MCAIRHQGYLYVPYRQLNQAFGKISEIEDKDGWEIELNGLPITISTFDHEDPASENAWDIYSINLDAVKLLADRFGSTNVGSYRPQPQRLSA